MSQFSTIFGVVLLGILCVGINALEKNIAQSSEQAADGLRELKTWQQMRSTMMEKYKYRVKRSSSRFQEEQAPNGVAKIYYRFHEYENTICSGTHLKPWIVLTTATCINSQKAGHLFVDVTYWEWGTVKTTAVNVSKIIIDPNFEEGKSENDRALLIIYSKYWWIENGFTLPIIYVSSELIVNYHWETFQDKWLFDPHTREFSVTPAHANVTLDYLKCNETAELPFWYCAEMLGNFEKFNKMDVGSPFYYKNFNIKTLLGLYTGRNINGRSPGRMYQSIWPSILWILKQLVVHIIPPQK